jgi:hypothetical protein
VRNVIRGFGFERGIELFTILSIQSLVRPSLQARLNEIGKTETRLGEWS